MKGALVGRDGSLSHRGERALDSRAPAAMVVAGLAAELGRILDRAEAEHGGSGPKRSGVVGVGLAVPGPFDEARGRFLIRGLPKFQALYGLELQPLLVGAEPRLSGLRFEFINDAAAFALGELRYGAGRGARRAVVLTLGTGCGSAFAVDGKLVTSGQGVPPDGYVYALPYAGGIVDDALSTRGLLAAYREARRAANGRTDDATWPEGAADVAAAARAGDAAARAAFETFGARLAEALGATFAAFRPDAIVLGGNISRSFDLFAGAARAGLARAGVEGSLVPAADIGGSALKGAASLLFEATEGGAQQVRP